VCRMDGIQVETFDPSPKTKKLYPSQTLTKSHTKKYGLLRKSGIEANLDFRFCGFCCFHPAPSDVGYCEKAVANIDWLHHEHDQAPSDHLKSPVMQGVLR